MEIYQDYKKAIELGINDKKLSIKNNKTIAAQYILLNDSKLFDIDNKLNNFLWNKEIGNLVSRKIPFQNIFINTEYFFEDGSELYGIQLNYDKEDQSIRAFTIYNNQFFYIGDLLATSEKDEKYRSKSRIKNFVCNFIDLLNDPDIELIFVERETDNDKNVPLVEKSKSIPTIVEIRLSGKLKIYMDKLESDGKFQYTHTFDVRGHWRLLRDSNRWGSKVGVKIWIPPYRKGEGLYVKKDYIVSKK